MYGVMRSVALALLAVSLSCCRAASPGAAENPASSWASATGLSFDRLPLMEPDPLGATVSIRVVPASSDDDWCTLGARLRKDFDGKVACDDDILHEFRDQPTASFCGGVLLKGGVVVTARHCIQECNNVECPVGRLAKASVVFDYRMDAGMAPTPETVRVQPMFVFALGKGKEDWAVLKTRPTAEARPTTEAHPFGGELAGPEDFKAGVDYQVSHYPLGLPQKHGLAELCEGKDEFGRLQLKATVFNNSSGAPVFSRSGDVLIGLLRGDTANRYSLDPSGGCLRHAECKDTCGVRWGQSGCGTVPVIPATWFAAAVADAAKWPGPETTGADLPYP